MAGSFGVRRQGAAGRGKRARAVIGGLARLKRRLVAFFFHAPVRRHCCPECGSTDLFDGRGTCQICQPM